MIIITILLVLIISVYIFLKYVFSYWKRKEFPNIEPQIPVGNMWNTIKGKEHFGITIWNIYKSSNDPFTGLFLFTSPALLIRDPNIVRKILVTDFAFFHSNGVYCNPEHDPMSENLFCVSGSRWREMRHQLAPTFSSGKLKGFFPIILQMAKRLENHLIEKANEKQIVNINDLCARYTMDIVANTFFGYEINSIEDPDNEFCAYHKRISTPNWYEQIMIAIFFLCPSILEFLKLELTPKYIIDFMVRIVKDTIEFREANNVQRKDFMQLLLQLRNNGEVNEDSNDWDVKSANKKKLTIMQCAANVQLFFVVGNDTTSNTTAYMFHELTHNPKVLEKLLIEIDDVLKKHNGDISYEAIQQMKYLDLCFKETLRKYPLASMVSRVASEDYEIPDTKYKLEKGTTVLFSLIGFHRDPNYFPNPDEFIPERFLDESKNYDERVYLPFGDGPRKCIGFRMGTLVAKSCIILLLSKFKLENMSPKDFEFDTKAVPLVPKDGIKLKVNLRAK